MKEFIQLVILEMDFILTMNWVSIGYFLKNTNRYVYLAYTKRTGQGYEERRRNPDQAA